MPGRCAGSATRPQIGEIIAYIDVKKSILGAPHLAAEHVPVFACSMGDNAIHYLGHVRMMGAVQPFISGAISKTVNMPEDATVEEVEQLHIDAWRLGLKAVAIYRDNCKVAQPLSTAKKGEHEAGRAGDARPRQQAIERVIEKDRQRSRCARSCPALARSKTFEFRVADCKGFVTVGEYADGHPGESSSGCRSRARPSPASWTPSPCRSATASSTACRCGLRRGVHACGSSRPA